MCGVCVVCVCVCGVCVREGGREGGREREMCEGGRERERERELYFLRIVLSVDLDLFNN